MACMLVLFVLSQLEFPHCGQSGIKADRGRPLARSGLVGHDGSVGSTKQQVGQLWDGGLSGQK